MDENPQIIVPAQPHRGVWAYAFLALGAIFAIGAGYVLWQTLQTAQVPDQGSEKVSYGQASGLTTHGSYAEAARIAGQVASMLRNESEEKTQAQRLEAYSRFMTGETNEQVEAVKQTKERFIEDEGRPTRQARDINRILEFMMVSRDPDVFNEAFSGEPFGHLKIEGDFTGSMRKLAELSQSLYPTTVATFVVASAEAAPINNFDKDYGATDAEKKKHADTVLTLLKQAEELYPNETSTTAVTDLLIPARYHFWRGVNYGVVALVYPEYLDDAEAAFNKVYTYYEATRNPDGEPYPLIQSRLPLTHLVHANTIFTVGGASRRADIETHLNVIITMVGENPSNFENQFLPLIYRTAAGTSLSSNKNLENMAGFYKPFAAFLAQYGLTY